MAQDDPAGANASAPSTADGQGFWRKPGSIAIILALLSIPIMWLAGQASILVAFAALCAYPFIDVPRIHAQRSWWRGVAVSIAAWIGLFIWLSAAVEIIDHLGEASLVLVVPLMLYPAALVLSAGLRVEGRINRRAPESERRIAGLAIPLMCAVFVLGPVALNMIPALTEAVTGNSPTNWEYSSEGDVAGATDDSVTIKGGDGVPAVFHFDPGVTFDFRGPGSAMVTGVAGRDWLKPGQRIAVSYVRRKREAWASNVNIWIERKGCAGDERWTSMPATASEDAASITGTTWDSDVPGRDPSRPLRSTFEFLPGQQLAYVDSDGVRSTTGQWRQRGETIIVGLNDCYAIYTGIIEGGAIRGEYANEMGAHAEWNARRKQP